MPRRFRFRVLHDGALIAYGEGRQRWVEAGEELILSEEEAASAFRDKVQRHDLELIEVIYDRRPLRRRLTGVTQRAGLA